MPILVAFFKSLKFRQGTDSSKSKAHPIDTYNNIVIIRVITTMPNSSEWSVYFYKTARGDCPPLEYIKSLDKKDQAKIARYINLLKDLDVKIRMPQARHLKGHLWELRPFPHRIIYFAHTGSRFVILHAFQKQTQKMPKQEIDTAKRRMKEIVEGER